MLLQCYTMNCLRIHFVFYSDPLFQLLSILLQNAHNETINYQFLFNGIFIQCTYKEGCGVKKIKQKLIETFSRSFELPSEVTLKLLRITLIGSIHAYIENHYGLVIFSNEKLVLNVYQGRVHITGKNFVLKMMLEHEILLEGDIADVRYEPNITDNQSKEVL